jgi:hypothetical protein
VIAVVGLAKVSTAQTSNSAAADQIDPPDHLSDRAVLPDRSP